MTYEYNIVLAAGIQHNNSLYILQKKGILFYSSGIVLHKTWCFGQNGVQHECEEMLNTEKQLGDQYGEHIK